MNPTTVQATPLPEPDTVAPILRSATVADAATIAELVESLNRSENGPTGYVTADTMARDLVQGQHSRRRPGRGRG